MENLCPGKSIITSKCRRIVAGKEISARIPAAIKDAPLTGRNGILACLNSVSEIRGLEC